MKTSLFILFSLLLLPVSLPVNARDPFWPIGYEGGAEKPVEIVEQPESPPPKTGRELSDAELRELAKKEAERIRQSLVRKGTMIAGDKIYAYVQNKWVTAGDVLPVEVEGRNYRLEIKSLTSDNIELEAHRAYAPLQIQNRKQP